MITRREALTRIFGTAIAARFMTDPGSDPPSDSLKPDPIARPLTARERAMRRMTKTIVSGFVRVDGETFGPALITAEVVREQIPWGDDGTWFHTHPRSLEVSVDLDGVAAQFVSVGAIVVPTIERDGRVEIDVTEMLPIGVTVYSGARSPREASRFTHLLLEKMA